MSEPKKGALFEYILRGDKERLKIVTHEGEAEYSADEVVRLIQFLVDTRFGMQPEVPDDSEKPQAALEAKGYMVRPFLDGTVQVRLRIPGLFWTYIDLSRDECAAIADTLKPPAAPPDDALRH